MLRVRSPRELLEQSLVKIYKCWFNKGRGIQGRGLLRVGSRGSGFRGSGDGFVGSGNGYRKEGQLFEQSSQSYPRNKGKKSSGVFALHLTKIHPMTDH